jgi:hypothetical protein
MVHKKDQKKKKKKGKVEKWRLKLKGEEASLGRIYLI